jgi:hypothetical protein
MLRPSEDLTEETDRSVAFLAGVALALLTSGGILLERLSLGAPRAGLVVNGVLTLAALLTLGFVEQRVSVRSSAVPQIVGAALGIVAVHLCLRLGWIAGAPWLSERPAQLVNDAVAVLATLGVVWACAKGLDLRLLVVTLVLLTAYRATGRFWHLDAAPHPFVLSVQDLVLAQFGGVAAALVFRRAAARLAG